ncbi:toxin biosynthesis protein [Venturia nashicola]|nr:toxin biosynthesis protein [Venturia nashicola]
MSAASFSMVRPLARILLLFISFFIGVQLRGRIRRVAAILHILLVFYFLASGPKVLALLPHSTLLVPLVHGFTVHATWVLLSREASLQICTTPRSQRIRTIVPLLFDSRGMLRHGAPASERKDGEENRLSFAIRKLSHATILWLLDYLFTRILLPRSLESMEINFDDIAPDKQSFLPSMVYRDLVIRAALSTQWIWTTYCLLNAAHDLCAILFVSVLGWDSASEWPPLYGSVSNAYSLRRFWGSFWHKVHVVPFEAFMPLSFRRQKGDSLWMTTCKNALRSLWVFAMSAACHARMNWALFRQNTIMAELRFWTTNWAVCLLETLLARVIEDTWVDKRFRRQHWMLRRVVGYFFVWAFFMVKSSSRSMHRVSWVRTGALNVRDSVKLKGSTVVFAEGSVYSFVDLDQSNRTRQLRKD